MFQVRQVLKVSKERLVRQVRQDQPALRVKWVTLDQRDPPDGTVYLE